MQAIKEHLKNVALSAFDNNVQKKLCEQFDYFCLEVLWKIATDPKRPNKRSKTIKIIISEERLDDYANLSSASQKDFDDKLTSFLKHRLDSFNPDHQANYDQLPPVGDWHFIL